MRRVALTALEAVTAVVVVLVLAPACATASEYAPDVAYSKRSVVDFDDVGVEGELMKPEGAFMRSGSDGGSAPGALAMAPAEDVAESAPPPPPPPESEPEPTTNVPASTKRLVIYTADFGVLVASLDDARTRFIASVEEKGGWLESQEDARVTVRVPAARFDEVVDGLVDYGPITHRRIDALDVTKRAFEMRLRIENAERARERLLALLADAREMKDILAIEVELRRLTEEIELLKGQLRTLEDQVAFSTISVTFQSNAPPPVVYGRRASRFEWINQVGAEHVQSGF